MARQITPDPAVFAEHLIAANRAVPSASNMAEPSVEQLEFAHGPIPVIWRRSARARRVSLRIDARLAVAVVTLPPRAHHAAGLRLLEDHSAWVRDKLASLPPVEGFADGSTITLSGQTWKIRHLPEGRGGAWFDGCEIHVAGSGAFVPRRVTDMLRQEARRVLAARVAQASTMTGLHPTKLVVRDAKTRWGSCTAGGVVMLNWRLIMAPVDIQQYVVVHELAHLRHMNHGPDFWALVQRHTPDTAQCRAWLKRNGAVLMRAGVQAKAASR